MRRDQQPAGRLVLTTPGAASGNHADGARSWPYTVQRNHIGAGAFADDRDVNS